MRLANLSKNFFSSAASPLIYTNLSNQLRKITLNRPKALNALNIDDVFVMKGIVQKLKQDQDYKALILAGSGDKAFCAGGDIKSLYEAKTSGKNLQILDSFFRNEYELDYTITKTGGILISFMDGIVMGGGVGISINSDIRIVTEYSTFAMPESKIGLFTDVAGGYFLNKVKNDLGLFLGLTGHRLKGYDLIEAGLADYFVPRDKLKSLEEALIAGVNKNSNIQEIKQIVSKFHEVKSSTIKEIPIAKEYFNINQTFQQFYNKLATNQQYYQLINSMCPLSIRVIFKQIQDGKSLNHLQNLQMDMRIVKRILEYKDFFEGVKNVLVDKNHKPQWTHDSPLNVTDQELGKIFSNLGDMELKIEQ